MRVLFCPRPACLHPSSCYLDYTEEGQDTNKHKTLSSICDMWLRRIAAQNNASQFNDMSRHGGRAPRSLNHSTERQWLVCFMFRPFRHTKHTSDCWTLCWLSYIHCCSARVFVIAWLSACNIPYKFLSCFLGSGTSADDTWQAHCSWEQRSPTRLCFCSCSWSGL